MRACRDRCMHAGIDDCMHGSMSAGGACELHPRVSSGSVPTRLRAVSQSRLRSGSWRRWERCVDAACGWDLWVGSQVGPKAACGWDLRRDLDDHSQQRAVSTPIPACTAHTLSLSQLRFTPTLRPFPLTLNTTFFPTLRPFPARLTPLSSPPSAPSPSRLTPLSFQPSAPSPHA